MSVYTRISEDELRAFLAPLSVGELLDFQGIEGGVVNSNYFVTTAVGRYVLTLFEDLESEDLPFFVELNQFLAGRGLPCARAVSDSTGTSVFQLKDRPACLFSRLPGFHLTQPTVVQCRAMGEALGVWHTQISDFPLHRPSDRDTDWFASSIERVMPRLSEYDARLLQSEWQHQSQRPLSQLPAGVIHADLFRDNVLFEGDRLTGLIDFYFACDGPLVYDLAITVNDWCSDFQGALDSSRLTAFLGGYKRQRPLTPDEQANWPTALRRAALRFWLSRLQESLFPAEGALVLIKDPEAFKRILLDRRRFAARVLSLADQG